MRDFAILSNDREVGKAIQDGFANNETPKYKFNFFAKFNFRTTEPVHPGGLSIEDNLFAIKQIGRPSPIIQYSDINYYGFRTKVATRTDFGVFNLTFYDDGPGRAHNILETYMATISPLTLVPNANNVISAQTIGHLPDAKELGPIENITLIHRHRGKDTKYIFHNPKITNFLLDELDMTQSEVTSVSMAFIYDTFYIAESPTNGEGTTPRIPRTTVTIRDIPTSP